MNQDIANRVIRFVAAETSVKVGGLTPDTTLFGDLGVDGSDGLELIAAFGKEFEVDLSGFKPSRHFGPEVGCFPPVALFYFLRTLILKDAHKAAGVVPITIRDLVEAAERKHWPLRIICPGEQA